MRSIDGSFTFDVNSEGYVANSAFHQKIPYFGSVGKLGTESHRCDLTEVLGDVYRIQQPIISMAHNIAQFDFEKVLGKTCGRYGAEFDTVRNTSGEVHVCIGRDY